MPLSRWRNWGFKGLSELPNRQLCVQSDKNGIWTICCGSRAQALNTTASQVRKDSLPHSYSVSKFWPLKLSSLPTLPHPHFYLPGKTNKPVSRMGVRKEHHLLVILHQVPCIRKNCERLGNYGMSLLVYTASDHLCLSLSYFTTL